VPENRDDNTFMCVCVGKSYTYALLRTGKNLCYGTYFAATISKNENWIVAKERYRYFTI